MVGYRYHCSWELKPSGADVLFLKKMPSDVYIAITQSRTFGGVAVESMKQNYMFENVTNAGKNCAQQKDVLV